MKQFPGTLIGLFIALLFLSNQLEMMFPISFILSFGSVLPSVLLIETPLNHLFGNNNIYYEILGTIIIEVILLFLLSYRYFKQIIRTKRENKPFNFGKLVIFFFLLQFLVHPIGFNVWALENVNQSNDSMFYFYAMETVKYSGLAFVPIGISVDLAHHYRGTGQKA